SFLRLIPPHPRTTLFPYTTLFRSAQSHARRANHLHEGTRALGETRPMVAENSAHAHGRRGSFHFARSTQTNRRQIQCFDREPGRSEEHTSELQSPCNLVCRLLLEK